MATLEPWGENALEKRVRLLELQVAALQEAMSQYGEESFRLGRDIRELANQIRVFLGVPPASYSESNSVVVNRPNDTPDDL